MKYKRILTTKIFQKTLNLFIILNGIVILVLGNYLVFDLFKLIFINLLGLSVPVVILYISLKELYNFKKRKHDILNFITTNIFLIILNNIETYAGSIYKLLKYPNVLIKQYADHILIYIKLENKLLHHSNILIINNIINDEFVNSIIYYNYKKIRIDIDIIKFVEAYSELCEYLDPLLIKKILIVCDKLASMNYFKIHFEGASHNKA